MLVNGCHTKISYSTLYESVSELVFSKFRKVVISRLFVLYVIICPVLFVNYANCLPKERENRHLFPLLGYLHGYKIGQNFAYQLPPFVLSPVVILPSVNQQQSVNVQKSSAGENYQENGGTFQIISPSKLISNITEVKDTSAPKETSKIDIIEKLDLSAKTLSNSEDYDTFRQILSNDTDVTTVKTTEIDYETVTPITDITNTEVENLNATTKLPGPYPAALYKNENISTLSITIEPLTINLTSPASLIQYNLTLPNMEKSQTFSQENPNRYENLSNENEQSNMYFNGYPPHTAPLSFRGYSYANPWYTPVADKLSITTSSYTNYESPPLSYNDRWQSFPSLRKSYPTSEFRPLAGLYHDGFLHKHLNKKTGFIPINGKYQYYN